MPADELTPERLAELERLRAEATPGPWCLFGSEVCGAVGTDDAAALALLALNRTTGGHKFDCLDEHADQERCSRVAANGDLIVAMRNSLPGLLRLAREAHDLRAEVVRLKAKLLDGEAERVLARLERPSEGVLLEGARSIGETMRIKSHIERAQAALAAMLAKAREEAAGG